jgi:hypothetical protein
MTEDFVRANLAVPKTSILVWLVTVIIFSLPGLNDCKSHALGTQNPSPVDKTASSDWQTILLREKGIRFKLPADWRHQDPDICIFRFIVSTNSGSS